MWLHTFFWFLVYDADGIQAIKSITLGLKLNVTVLYSTGRGSTGDMSPVR
jgi:hypothetical protein